MRNFILGVLGFFLLGIYGNIFAQDSHSNQFQTFNNNGEIYFRLKNSDNINIDQISDVISIDRATNKNWIYAYANEQEFNKLTAFGAEIEILQHPGTLINPRMIDVPELNGITDWDFYPTYEAYVSMMYQFVEDFPELCSLVTIGESTENRQILAIVISSGGIQTGKPQFLYTSTMHGDETTGYVLCLRLIDYLLNNYEESDRITTLVDNMEIWINPLANPDGTYASGNSTVNGATRGNANNINLNRNFPDPEDGEHPDGNEWQVETEYFMQLAEENNFVMSANIHGGEEVCNYPWDTWSKLHADDDWWQYVCRQYADTAQLHSPSSYMTNYDNGITNGYQWYSISGGRQDYMNYFHHCREFTLEISHVKLLPANLLPDFWEYNYRSLLNYMEQALYGFSGNLIDGETLLPIQASVFIENHDFDESWVLSDELSGMYYRPIYEGTYNITFFKPGYEPLTFLNIQAVNGELTIMNIALAPTESGINGNKVLENFNVSQNPGNGFYKLIYTGRSSIETRMVIYNFNGELILDTSSNFSLGESSYVIDISDYSSGLYFMIIEMEEQTGVIKLIKK